MRNALLVYPEFPPSYWGYTYALDRPAVLEDLRLPFRPPQAYGDAWRGWGDWLGTGV